MNIEGQDMETYQLILVPMSNTKITEELYFNPISPVLKYQAWEDLDNKEALKDSLASSDNIEK